MNILIVDGQGGRLGRKLLEGVRKACPGANITAVGTNSIFGLSFLTCARQRSTMGRKVSSVSNRPPMAMIMPSGYAAAAAEVNDAISSGV